MNEKQPSAEKCIDCPNRSKLSKVLARIANKSELAEGCEGFVTVAHGIIQTEIRHPGEPSPKKSEFEWTRMTGSAREDGDRRYSRTDWSKEDICGREIIEPREGEVPYRQTDDLIQIAEDGSRHARFISGNAEQIADHDAMLAMCDIIDSAHRIDDEDSTNEEINEAKQTIASYGLRRVASSHRKDKKEQ